MSPISPSLWLPYPIAFHFWVLQLQCYGPCSLLFTWQRVQVSTIQANFMRWGCPWMSKALCTEMTFLHEWQVTFLAGHLSPLRCLSRLQRVHLVRAGFELVLEVTPFPCNCRWLLTASRIMGSFLSPCPCSLDLCSLTASFWRTFFVASLRVRFASSCSFLDSATSLIPTMIQSRRSSFFMAP